MTTKDTNKFDFKEIMKADTKNIIVTRKNEPNLDKMAKAFYELLKK